MEVPPVNYLEINTHIEKANTPIFNWNKGKTISKWFWEAPKNCSINRALDTEIGKISELSVAFYRPHYTWVLYSHDSVMCIW